VEFSNSFLDLEEKTVVVGRSFEHVLVVVENSFNILAVAAGAAFTVVVVKSLGTVTFVG
jgi:hypothetical protein